MVSPKSSSTPAASSASPASLPFRNPDLPAAARIDDLVSRLTLPEKISQLMHESPAIERLGVPAYNWWNEACHGIGRNGRATIFPQVIGLGATWNRALVHRVASAISDEARAKHHAAARAGRRGQYQGLTFWTPNINIFRDPRWGRGQETFGEDPFLTAELGVQMVRGLQGDHPKYLKAAACAKHFAVHSGPEAERHTFDARPTPKDLAETYLPAFKRLVAAGVESVMGAYNRVLGEPACGSKFLLVDILRGQWRFKGHVVSDCFALDDFHLYHKVTKNAAESAALALKNGCDLNCGCTYNDLSVAVRDGLVSEAQVDTALRRLLATKFKLGLFDPEDRVPFAQASLPIVDSADHRKLARAAAAESIVLLKNANQTLPLRRDPLSVHIVGPMATSVDAMIGNYYGLSPQIVTILEGLTEGFNEHTIVEYRSGCSMQQPIPPGQNYTYLSVAGNDVVIAVMGFNSMIEGEEGDAVSSLSGGDRGFIELPQTQRDFLRELRKHAKKLVLVLTGGSAIAIPDAHEFCDAILHVWYPGCEGGHAVADVLFGAVTPSGKLPVTVPKRTEDLPPFSDYHMRGRTYRFAEIEPLYPFGFGLSYAKLSYAPLVASAEKLRAGQELVLRTTVSNSSDHAAHEAVQCYLVPPRSPDAPRAVLVDFQKINVPARGNTAIEFRLTSDALLQVNAAGEHVWQPGTYEFVIGSASPGPRAQALGAPAPATTRIEFTA